MKFYAQCLRNGNISYSAHVGMTQEIISTLLADLGGTSIEFISEQNYFDALAEQALERGI